jgi:hypothetical protein
MGQTRKQKNHHKNTWALEMIKKKNIASIAEHNHHTVIKVLLVTRSNFYFCKRPYFAKILGAGA